MITQSPILERRVELFRLRGIVGRKEIGDETNLDEQTDPTHLKFSKLSGYHEWVIEAEFEGRYTATIVTCNWSGGACFVAHGEYHVWRDSEEHIPSHAQIIPYVQKWLTRTELYGILCDGDAIDCPHLEIFGRSA